MIKENLRRGIEYCPTISHAVRDSLLTEMEQELNLKSNFKVSCFTTKNDNLLMWSHYANSHKGFCVEYNTECITSNINELHLNLYPVVYCNDLGDVSKEVISNNLGNLDNEVFIGLFIKGFLRKSLVWSYEQEWRLVKLSKEPYSQEFFKIKKIYLGHKMPNEERKIIIGFCNKNSIPYVGMKIDSQSYKIVECNVICENCDKFKNYE